MENKLICYMELASSTALLGATIVLAKFLITIFPVLILLELRFFFGTIIFFIIILFYKDRDNLVPITRLCKKDWYSLIGQAICSGLFNIFLLYGLHYTTATAGGLLSSTVPIFTSILAWIILKESISPLKWLAILVVVIGITLLNVNGQLHSAGIGTLSLRGNGLILMAVISGSMLSIFIKMLPNYVPPFLMAFMASLIPLIIYLPMSIGELHTLSGNIPIYGWFLLLIYAMVANVLFPLIWNLGLMKVPANTASLFTGIIPISTMFLAIPLLGEQVNIVELLGMCLILAAIFMGVFEKS